MLHGVTSQDEARKCGSDEEKRAAVVKALEALGCDNYTCGT